MLFRAQSVRANSRSILPVPRRDALHAPRMSTKRAVVDRETTVNQQHVVSLRKWGRRSPFLRTSRPSSDPWFANHSSCHGPSRLMTPRSLVVDWFADQSSTNCWCRTAHLTHLSEARRPDSPARRPDSSRETVIVSQRRALLIWFLSTLRPLWRVLIARSGGLTATGSLIRLPRSRLTLRSRLLPG